MVEVNVYGEVHVHTADETSGLGKPPAEMAIIKRAVKKRDSNTCQVCGEHDKIIECHHIMPVSRYPELEGDVSNIIAMCQSCHRKYHDRFEGSEGAVSFAKFIRDNGGDFK